MTDRAGMKGEEDLRGKDDAEAWWADATLSLAADVGLGLTNPEEEGLLRVPAPKHVRMALVGLRLPGFEREKAAERGALAAVDVEAHEGRVEGGAAGQHALVLVEEEDEEARKVRQAREQACATRITSWARGRRVRRGPYGKALQAAMAEREKVRAQWAVVERAISKLEAHPESGKGWDACKDEEKFSAKELDDEQEAVTIGQDLVKGKGYDACMVDTQVGLSAGGEPAECVPEAEVPEPGSDEDQHYDGEERHGEEGDAENEEDALSSFLPDEASFAKVLFTRDVLRWREQADVHLLGMFNKKVGRLARGERSSTLQKDLKLGSSMSPGVQGKAMRLYEAYLGQTKGGHRILYRELVEDRRPVLLIYDVPHHDRVSRSAHRILAAEARLHTQLRTEDPAVIGAGPTRQERAIPYSVLDANSMLVDPYRNAPLTLHEVRGTSMERLGDRKFRPPLRLTGYERRIVSKQDCSVMVLGAAGSGKTMCIAHRIASDHEKAMVRRVVEPPSCAFVQVFVARSPLICRQVRRLVSIESGNACKPEYRTFRQFTVECMRSLGLSSLADETLRGKAVSFHSFKDFFSETCKKWCTLDPLVCWQQIRTYIKGSMEAMLAGGALPEQEYLALGRNRCTIVPEDRELAYKVYRRYASWCRGEGLRDECDRISDLLQAALERRPRLQAGLVDKLYVDECQDYTQAEIALFALVCGPSNLFLAGDPAQSVELGVNFRFDEVRSVIYHLGGGGGGVEKMQHPEVLHQNFRSHSGILDVAAKVLGLLFVAFPSAAKRLPPDTGVFCGPVPMVSVPPPPKSRASVSMLDGHKVLESLLGKNDRLVVLMPDDSIGRLTGIKESFSNSVLGVVDAKGLEFPDVGLVDFFCSLPREQHAGWKDLLSGRGPGSGGWKPEMEGRLKLLYTGITRCCHRLYFVETEWSEVGDKFMRWLCDDVGKGMRLDLDLVQGMHMTSDEWRVRGIDFALKAEAKDQDNEPPAKVLEWVDKAADALKRSGSAALVAKIDVHRRSLRHREHLARRRTEGEPSKRAANVNAREISQLIEETSALAAELVAQGLIRDALHTCSELQDFLDMGSKGGRTAAVLRRASAAFGLLAMRRAEAIEARRL